MARQQNSRLLDVILNDPHVAGSGRDQPMTIRTLEAGGAGECCHGAGWSQQVFDAAVHSTCVAPDAQGQVLAPLAVDQVASLCSCGQETVGRAVGPVSMNGPITRMRTTATRDVDRDGAPRKCRSRSWACSPRRPASPASWSLARTSRRGVAFVAHEPWLTMFRPGVPRPSQSGLAHATHRERSSLTRAGSNPRVFQDLNRRADRSTATGASTHLVSSARRWHIIRHKASH